MTTSHTDFKPGKPTTRKPNCELQLLGDFPFRIWLTLTASKWAKFARHGHDVAWEFGGPGGSYTGRMLIDGEFISAFGGDEEVPRPSLVVGHTAYYHLLAFICGIVAVNRHGHNQPAYA